MGSEPIRLRNKRMLLALRTWGARVSLLALALGIGLFLFVISSRSMPLFVGLGTAVVVLLALAHRRGWWTLIGPVFYFEMVRAGRKSRVSDVRIVYSLILFLVLISSFAVYLIPANLSLEEGFLSTKLKTALLADYLLLFFLLFMAIQYLAILILTPAYLAGAVAEERDRDTLDALLVTDLRDREIVLGIILPRLIHLLLIFIVGMPFLSFLQFLGGIEPSLVLAGFAFLTLTILSTASVSVMLSLYTRHSRSALLKAYLVTWGYLALSGLSQIMVSFLSLGKFPSTDTWTSPVSLYDVVEWCSAGNFISWVVYLVKGIAVGGTLDALLLPALQAYAWFHSGVTALCTLWIALRFRAVLLAPLSVRVGARKQAGDGSVWLLGLNGRPAVFDRPMLWKELYAEHALRPPWRRALGWGILVAAFAVPMLTSIYFFDGFRVVGHNEHLAGVINIWVRYLTMLMGLAMVVTVAVRAGGSVAGERDRGTLDGLLATPLETKTILRNKWLASVFYPRRSAFFLALVWFFSWWAGALDPLAVPCVVLAWFGFAGFAAAVGLWFSVIKKTGHRASFWTMATLAFVLFCGALLAEDLDGPLAPSEAQTVFPPAAFFHLAFSPSAPESLPGTAPADTFRLAPWWSAAWLAFAWATWRLTCWQFRRQFNRKNDRSASKLPAATGQALIQSPAEIQNHRVTGRASVAWLRLSIIGALLALPTCLLIGVLEYRRALARVELEEAMAEADRLDYPWRWEDLNARRKEIPPEKNAALVVVEAGRLLPIRYYSDYSPALRHFSEVPLPEQLNAPLQKHMRRFVAQSQETLQKARRLADLSEGRFPQEGRGQHELLWGPYHYNSNILAELLQIAAALAAQDGKDEDAMLLCRALINRGRAVGDEVAGMAVITRLQSVTGGVATLERVLALGQPSESALAAVQKLLADESSRSHLLQYYRCQRAARDRILESMTEERSMSNPFFLDLGRPKQKGISSLWKAIDLDILLGGPLTSIRAKALHFSNELVEAAKLPEHLQEAAAIQVNTRASSIRTAMALHFIDISHFSSPIRVMVARTRCAAVALACERYRLARGKWPQKLQDLVPIYLPGVPDDPYDGKPLRLRRFKDGVVIYSVGPDLIDDGGKLERRNSRPVPGTDVGFQLWDPARRRQPAGKPPSELVEPGGE
jgi:ABC-type Na+ efflux pump permease subunit